MHTVKSSILAFNNMISVVSAVRGNSPIDFVVVVQYENYQSMFRIVERGELQKKKQDSIPKRQFC